MCLYFVIYFFFSRFIHLFESQNNKEGEIEGEQKLSSFKNTSPTQVVEAKLLGPSPTVFPGT